MVCNEMQWSATSCNNKAKRIVLSTKQHWLSVVKVVHNFFAKKNHQFSNLPFNALLYYI